MLHDYEKIVHEALNEPGRMAAAYSAFWNYSLGNQFLAMFQLGKAEPINTYKGWQSLGRQVRKGEKAIELLMPVTKEVEADNGETETRRFFIARKNWFGLHQTDGEEYAPPVPGFDTDKLLAELSITQEPFQHTDGNCMGYALPGKRVIAVSPVAYDAFKTKLHEVGHVLLHGEVDRFVDGRELEHSVRECEAELTAYLVKTSLGQLDNLEYSRGYIQHYLGADTKEKIRYGKVFAAADAILKAGRVVEPEPVRPVTQPLAVNEATP